MRTIAYCALHYGQDYLGYAIRSVIDHCDQFIVAYSDVGSHGHRVDHIPCPDSMETLYEIARRSAGDKLLWHANRWDYEGQQRDFAVSLATQNGADVVLVVDSDEIWPDGLAQHIIEIIERRTDKVQSFEDERAIRLPFVHFWRSFHRAVLHDPAYPVRVIRPQYTGGEVTYVGAAIAHMGYAQSSEIVKYKLLTHGHRNEFRRDVDWFNDVYMANRQHDCHPVGSEYWNPEAVNPLDYMPEFMQKHPYYKLDVIP